MTLQNKNKGMSYFKHMSQFCMLTLTMNHLVARFCNKVAGNDRTRARIHSFIWIHLFTTRQKFHMQNSNWFDLMLRVVIFELR